MNNLDKLLQCSEDVQWKTLGEVAELKRGTTITAKSKTDGNIPVISGGQKTIALGEFKNGVYILVIDWDVDLVAVEETTFYSVGPCLYV